MGHGLWSFSVAMFGFGMMQFFMAQTDRVALGAYRSAHDVGIYAVVASIVAYETIFLQSVNQIFAPVIPDIHTRGEREVLGRLFQTLRNGSWGSPYLSPLLLCATRPRLCVHLAMISNLAGWHW